MTYMQADDVTERDRLAVGALVVVCLVLLIAAGTLVRSSSHLLKTDPGFKADHLIAISVLNPSLLGYSASRTETLSGSYNRFQ